MNLLLRFIWSWVMRHWMALIIATFVSWVTVGVTYLTLRPTTSVTVGSGGRYVAVSTGYKPTFGCATGAQFFGWSHEQHGGSNVKESKTQIKD